MKKISVYILTVAATFFLESCSTSQKTQVEEPKKEVVKKETPAPAAPVREEAKPAVAEEAPAKSGEAEIFTIHKPEFVSKINIIGQIDLAALNQSTRPKKKSKEEKRREREEKENSRRQR